MTRDEKRMIRREWIQDYLRIAGFTSVHLIKGHVRMMENHLYGYELRVYHVDR